MNALILSAVFGVIMMFSSVMLKNKTMIRVLAVGGILLLLVSNLLETYGTSFFNVDTKGMMAFDRFALFFNSIVFLTTLIYFLLSARDMEKVGVNYGEYFSLIFFIICGIILTSSFKSLLILFLGIEI